MSQNMTTKDDIASPLDGAVTVETDTEDANTNHGESIQDGGASEITDEDGVSTTDAESIASSAESQATELQARNTDKSSLDLQQLLVKLDKIREEHYGVCGKKYTCNNIRIFVVIYSVLILLQSSISSYFFTVSDHIWKRYAISDFEMDFIHGSDEITIICSLIFTAYYGNKMNKPIAIMAGSLVFAFGSVLCAVPYWTLGTRKSYTVGKIQTYLDSGLCQIGHSAADNSSGSSTTFGEQCEYLPASLHSSENRAAFSVLCVAQLIMGLGKAFVLPLGVVYAEEAERSSESPIYISAILVAHSLGGVLGTLLGTWFIIYPEDLKEELSIAGWYVGAWWIGFPLLGSVLFVVSLTLLLFPRWIREPKWLLYRRYRKIKRDYRRQKREEEERRRRRKRKREQKRRERERKNIHAKRSSGTVSSSPTTENAQNCDVSLESSADEPNSLNTDLSDSDITVTVENTTVDASSHSKNGAVSPSQLPDKSEFLTDSEFKHKDVSVSENQTEKTNSTGNTSDKQLHENENNKVPENCENERTTQQGTGERRYRPKSEKRGVRIQESARDREGEDEVKNQWVKDEEKEKRALEKNKARHRLGRKLKDLPQNLKFLIINPFFTLTALGVTASFYYIAGNQSRMPVYLVDQFQYEPQEARLITGLVFGLSSLLGLLIAALLIYKFEVNLAKQFRAVLVLSGLVGVGPLISFAFGCEVSYGPVETNELGDLQPSCALGLCDCSVSQFYPVCSKDGTRYYSPCHAGCNVADLRKDGSGQEFVFAECVCLDDGEAGEKFCADACPMGAGYIVLLFITLLLHAMCYITVVLLFLRGFTEKLRCLTVGFAIWIVYVLAITPGTAIYKYCHSSACDIKDDDCDDNEICWRIDERRFRYNTQAATLVFLFVACVLFIFAYVKMDKKKLGELDEGTEKPTQSGERNPAFQNDNTSTV